MHILEPLGIVGALALVIGLGWRKPQRWVMWGAAACAILPDLLDHVHPVAALWHRLPFTGSLEYVHSIVQTTSRGFPLAWGLAHEAVVIGLTVWIILAPDRRQARPQAPEQDGEA